MPRKMCLRNITILFLLCLCSRAVFGQATFWVGVSSTTGADIGVTELTGSLTLNIYTGTTVAAPMTIQYSATITNRQAGEIMLIGTGGLNDVAPSPALDRANNTIIIDIPAGANNGSIRIQGVRVALVGLNSPRVTASITGAIGGNNILAGQNVVPVIETILPPFSVDVSSDRPLSWTRTEVVNSSTSLLIKEGYVTAFSSSLISSQTTPTTFRINPFPAIPAGIKLTFAPIATSTESGAVMTTSSGAAETIPRDDGSTTVTYVFSEVPTSSRTLESFQVFINMVITPPAELGGVAFQATLLPIGIAVPNSQFPSTETPRYAERTLPDETDLVTGSVTLAFPFRTMSDATYTGIAVTNPQNFRVTSTFTAFDKDGYVIFGPNITNPVSQILPRKGQIAKLAGEIFGRGFNAATYGSILVKGKTSQLLGFYLTGDESGGSRLDGATADIDTKQVWTWPVVFHQGPSPFNSLELFNPGTNYANTTLRLYDSSGTLLATAYPIVPPSGSYISDLQQVFPTINLNSFNGGYILGKSDNALVARQTFGNALESNVLPGQVGGGQVESFTIAHFASGGGYTTELSFINLDPAAPAIITLTAVDNSGQLFAIQGNPANLTIKPGFQEIRTIQSLFPGFGSGLVTGAIRVAITPYYVGFFKTVPVLAGALRFSATSGYASAVLPTVLAPASDFIYSHVAQNPGYYTGVTLLNTSSAVASVTIEVFTKTGTSVGYLGTTLQPGQRFAKLLYEMVPSSANQVGGYIRVRCSVPITSFALFGSIDGKSLSAIPPQVVQ